MSTVAAAAGVAVANPGVVCHKDDAGGQGDESSEVDNSFGVARHPSARMPCTGPGVDAMCATVLAPRTPGTAAGAA